MRYGVIELYPSGIGLTMTNSSFHGRMSSARSIDLPGATKLKLASRLAGNAKFSPAGHWVAYQSDESGRNEIYVRPFPAANGGGKWTVSQGGGTQPRWRGDSKELFYLAPDGNVMAVPVSTGVDGFQPGTPGALFKGPPNADGWDVSADGKRFLFPVPAGESAQAPFTIGQNWISLLKK
jgi:hypothetical protein